MGVSLSVLSAFLHGRLFRSLRAFTSGIPLAANGVPVSIKSFIVADGLSQHVGSLSGSVHFESTDLSFKYLLLTSLLPQVFPADRAMIRTAEIPSKAMLRRLTLINAPIRVGVNMIDEEILPLRMGTTNTSVTTSIQSLAWYFV